MNPIAKIVLPVTLVVVGSAQLNPVESLLPASFAVTGATTGIEAAAAADTAQPAVIFESEVVPGEPALQNEPVIEAGNQGEVVPVQEDSHEQPQVAAEIGYSSLGVQGIPAHWLGNSCVDDWGQY